MIARLAVVVSACSGLCLGVEQWTDTQKRSIQADYVRHDASTVYLRTMDGTVHAVPLAKLQADDVKRIHSKTSALASTAGAVLPPWPPEQSAERIDRHLEAHLAAMKLKPNDALTEEQFVRRAYLDIAGRIPSFEETTAYLGDKSRSRRSDLIDRLLSSSGRNSHLFNFFADLFRVKTRVSEYISGASYIQWLKRSIEENLPYNEMVKAMLTASGHYQDEPAVGYLMRDAGMPLDNLSLTAQYFLGTDLSCAQCHDHPFDDWTQLEFYQLAAFMGGTRTLPDGGFLKREFAAKGLPEVSREAVTEAAFKHREYDGVQKSAMLRFLNANEHRVVDDPELRLKIPHDYAYEDRKPGEVVEPKVIFGAKPDLGKYDSTREAFADWLTANDNPRFAVTIANRMWARAFGAGAVEPLHDLGDLTGANVPGLIEILGQEMQRVGYDLRAFEGILYRTRAWQRQAARESLPMGAPYHFAGPKLRRLSAAQIWDSILTMVLEDVDYFNGKRDYTEWEKTFAFERLTVTGEQFEKQFAMQEELGSRYGGYFGWPEADEVARQGKNPLWFDERCETWRLYGDVLIRASELTQPAHPSHLLSILGQSSRDLSCSDSTNGSIPLAMALMNGRGSQVITTAGSRILDAVERFKGDGPKVDTVFLSILSRLPSSDERSIAYKTIRHGGPGGYQDVVWSLLNTREFLFVQ